MNKCNTCGNEYDKLMQITIDNESHYFDSFECAIHALAPKCAGCGLNIIGHGVEIDELMFCSAHCSRSMGKVGVQDRVMSEWT